MFELFVTGFMAIKGLFGLFVAGSMAVKGLFVLCLAGFMALFMACLWLVLWANL